MSEERMVRPQDPPEDRPMNRMDPPEDRRPMDRQLDRPTDRPTDRPMDRPMDSPHTTTAQAPAKQMDMWPDMSDFRQRFDQLQAEFIEDPKSAVHKAEQLMEEAVDRVTKTMHERIHAMHGDVAGKDGDTEQMRLAMRSFKMWIESLGDRRAA
jgi:hypothetical protein